MVTTRHVKARDMFPGFTTNRVKVNDVSINVCHGGKGAPVLLLHGYPQTHVMWHRVAHVLAQHFQVVCPDLRGYGDSDKPRGRSDHAAYAKRTMAQDQIEVMRSLGFSRFAVVGHDRGARVALRLAPDRPEAVSHLAVLDIIPTKTIYETLDRRRATTVWRYFFLVHPYDLPERMILADPEWYLTKTLDEWCGTPVALSSEAVAEYARCFDAATVHASCEDYRAGSTIDLLHDSADASQRLSCPILVMWSKSVIGRQYDVRVTWRTRALNVHWKELDCGHFLAEERPDETASELASFFAATGESR